MAPEQVLGRGADARTDVYGLGVVLYEMLAGSAPFKASTAAVTMAKQLIAEPEPLSRARARADDAVSLSLDAIVRRCLFKEPNARFQSARDLRDALAALAALAACAKALEAPPPITGPAPVACVTQPIVKVSTNAVPTNRMALVAAAIALVAVAGVIAWLVGSRWSEPTSPRGPAPSEASPRQTPHRAPEGPSRAAAGRQQAAAAGDRGARAR